MVPMWSRDRTGELGENTRDNELRWLGVGVVVGVSVCVVFP